MRAIVLLFACTVVVWADETTALERRVGELEKQLAARDAASLQESIDAYLETAGGAPEHPPHAPVDLSAVLLLGGGASSATNAQLETLQDGGHDPKRRGFTLQQLEVSIAGAVGPRLRGEAHVIFVVDPFDGETGVELEEAFLQTVSLPGGFEIEAGFFFTEFGHRNPLHPHDWVFVDTPVVLTRLFGPDGQRQAGVRIAWHGSWVTVHAGMQNAEGETVPSFRANDEVGEERPVAGRPFVDLDVQSLGDFIYLLRVEASFELHGGWEVGVGASGLVGPNYTGPDGYTIIYGLDVAATWHGDADDEGWPFFTFQLELLARRFRADAFETLAEETFDDHGLYAQIVYGWRRPWWAGLRVGYASADGVEAAGDPFRDDRLRVSLLLGYHVSERARVRLQMNYDDDDALADEFFTFWLVVEIGLGGHAEHDH